MIDNTILVVDADQETEEKIVSTLEAEGYLVFTASGRDISSGMAERISPALIYLKPTANSVEGFEICKTIHSRKNSGMCRSYCSLRSKDRWIPGIPLFTGLSIIWKCLSVLRLLSKRLKKSSAVNPMTPVEPVVEDSRVH